MIIELVDDIGQGPYQSLPFLHGMHQERMPGCLMLRRSGSVLFQIRTIRTRNYILLLRRA